MRGLGFFPVLAIALLFSGTALAQATGDNSSYFVTYYSNAVHSAAVPDGTVRVVNDGDVGATLWASFYTFDDSQEMEECCSCAVSQDGLLSESVNSNLAGNPLTGILSQRGVIKVISSSVAANGPANYTNIPTPGLRVWSSHVQRQTPTAGAYYTTEAPAADSNLASEEEWMLETLCFYIHLFGHESGQGVCSCTNEDVDF